MLLKKAPAYSFFTQCAAGFYRQYIARALPFTATVGSGHEKDTFAICNYLNSDDKI